MDYLDRSPVQVHRRPNRALVLLNLLSLFATVLVPFAAKVLSEDSGFAFGPVFYSSVMVLWCVSYVLMVLVARRNDLWLPGTAPTVPTNIILGGGSALGLLALSIPLAFVSPSLAEYSWLLTPFLAALVGRVRGRTIRTIAGPRRFTRALMRAGSRSYLDFVTMFRLF